MNNSNCMHINVFLSMNLYRDLSYIHIWIYVYSSSSQVDPTVHIWIVAIIIVWRFQNYICFQQRSISSWSHIVFKFDCGKNSAPQEIHHLYRTSACYVTLLSRKHMSRGVSLQAQTSAQATDSCRSFLIKQQYGAKCNGAEAQSTQQASQKVQEGVQASQQGMHTD